MCTWYTCVLLLSILSFILRSLIRHLVSQHFPPVPLQLCTPWREAVPNIGTSDVVSGWRGLKIPCSLVLSAIWFNFFQLKRWRRVWRMRVGANCRHAVAVADQAGRGICNLPKTRLPLSKRSHKQNHGIKASNHILAREESFRPAELQTATAATANMYSKPSVRLAVFGFATLLCMC